MCEIKMRIKDFMTSKLITIDEDTSIHDAKKIMETNKIRRLPIIKHTRLIGLVTEKMLLEAAPSQATSLSIHELQYLLAKMSVRDIMIKDPYTLTSDTPAEEALKVGQEKGFGAFPVVDNGELVGIVTESDIVRIITNVLGVNEKGVRIDILAKKEFGSIQKIMSIIDTKKIMLLSLMVLDKPKGDEDKCFIFLRFKCDNADSIADELKAAGLNVTYAGACL